eukprot:11701432-Alexandrium_andersonii.AAC.1
MNDMCTWDIGLSIRARSRMDEKRVRVHRAIGAGSLWCGEYAHKSGFEPSAECKQCGHRSDTPFHRFWEFPAFEKQRMKHGLSEDQVRTMPLALASFGVAPKLTLAIEGPAWVLPQSHEIPAQLASLLEGVPQGLMHLRTLGEVIRGPSPEYGVPASA